MESNEQGSFPGVVEVNLTAIRHNLRVLREKASGSELMAIIKADAYGHGRLPVGLTAMEEGVNYFGISQVSEALRFRDELDAAGIGRDRAKIFGWLTGPDQDWDAALSADLEVSASSPEVLERIASAAKNLGVTAPVHLKVDVGMSRGGAVPGEFGALVERAAALEKLGLVKIVGIWSHLPQADDLTDAGRRRVAEQVSLFEGAVAAATEAGLSPRWRHLAATGGTLWHPSTHFDLVRVGIGMYGLSPDAEVDGSAALGLQPALSLGAPLTLVKHIRAGQSVSYGETWTAKEDRWVGLVPLGYADGVPRHASNIGPVTVRAAKGPIRSRILGRVCMDQVVIDLGGGENPAALEGDWASLIGQGDLEPTADDWAKACGTINYEIVTRLAPSIPRRHVNEEV